MTSTSAGTVVRGALVVLGAVATGTGALTLSSARLFPSGTIEAIYTT